MRLCLNVKACMTVNESLISFEKFFESLINSKECTFGYEFSYTPNVIDPKTHPYAPAIILNKLKHITWPFINVVVTLKEKSTIILTVDCYKKTISKISIDFDKNGFTCLLKSGSAFNNFGQIALGLDANLISLLVFTNNTKYADQCFMRVTYPLNLFKLVDWNHRSLALTSKIKALRQSWLEDVITGEINETLKLTGEQVFESPNFKEEIFEIYKPVASIFGFSPETLFSKNFMDKAEHFIYEYRKTKIDYLEKSCE